MKILSFLNFSRLQRQLVLTVTLTLIIGFCITTYLSIKHDMTAMEEAERAKIDLFTSTVTNVIREEMVTGNAENVSNWLTNIQNSGSFKQVRLLRTDKVEAFSDNHTIDKFNKSVQTAGEVTYNETIDGEPVYTSLIPIVRDDRCVPCHGYENNPVRGILQVSASRAEL